MLGFIAVVDIDRLWLSAIKRQMADVFAEEERLPLSEKGTAKFYFADALEDAVAFINSEPAVDRRRSLRGETWRVVTADGETISKFYKDPAIAWRVRDCDSGQRIKGDEDGRQLVASRNAGKGRRI